MWNVCWRSRETALTWIIVVSEQASSRSKALVVATVPGFFTHMHTVHEVLCEIGYKVEAAANFDVASTVDFSSYDACHNICFSRSPFSANNLRAYRQLHGLISKEKYGLVFCNTPVGGVLGRLASRHERKNSTRVVYMAHGFHFFKGASLTTWLLYYPVEWICSWMTDVLITITREDHDRARKHFHARKTCYVPGVGIDIDRFANADGSGVRKELGIPDECHVILSVGELNHNKNQQVMVRALSGLSESIHYVIAGAGPEYDSLELLAQELGVSNRLHLLGTRDDVPRLMAASDVYVLPSLREGLNVSLMEAMASGLPVVCKRIRGNVDLINDGLNGVLVDDDDANSWAKAIALAFELDDVDVSNYNKDKIMGFKEEAVKQVLLNIL